MPTIPQADLEQYGEVIDRLVNHAGRQVTRQHVPADEGRGHVRRRPRQVRTPALPAGRRADLRAREARRQRAHPHRQLPSAALPRRRNGRSARWRDARAVPRPGTWRQAFLRQRAAAGRADGGGLPRRRPAAHAPTSRPSSATTPPSWWSFPSPTTKEAAGRPRS